MVVFFFLALLGLIERTAVFLLVYTVLGIVSNLCYAFTVGHLRLCFFFFSVTLLSDVSESNIEERPYKCV